MTSRDQQREATRSRILDHAVQLLVDRGYSALTTVAVQREAGVSRGALLHHFPTIQQLAAAVVEHLVAGNEEAVRAAAARRGSGGDPVSRAIETLHEALSQKTFHAELELWAAARTDEELKATLREAERRANRDLRRVVDEIFGPIAAAHENYRVVSDLTVMLLRGLAISSPLSSNDQAARQLIDQWSIMAADSLGFDRGSL